MSREVSLHTWAGSYHVAGEGRWVSGSLCLGRTTLRFQSARSAEPLVSLRLSRVTRVRMETSSWVFGVLTVLERGGVKHWFGSLGTSRAAAFHLLEHFWRAGLLSPARPRPLSRGQELIGLVSAAQRRLEEAGTALEHQGEQLGDALQGLERVESDLGVADKLLSALESPAWWPFSRLTWAHQQEKKKKSSTGAVTGPRVLLSIPAVVSRAEGDAQPGGLVLLVSGVELRDAGGQLTHRFLRDEVDEVRVISPYQISLRQRFIAKPDVCFRVDSARMPEALPLLEAQYQRKLETSHLAAFQATPGAPRDACATGGAQDVEVAVEVSAGGLTQLQLQVLQPAVTEAEAQELNKMLEQLRGLALEAESELERQDEALEVLSTGSHHAATAIDRHTRRMRRLL